ncbi:hypothetical protein Hanom_Chr17g01559541 [Helianthus anomalus]
MLAEHGSCSVFCLLYFAWEDAIEGSGNPLLFLFFSFNPENTKGRQKHTFSNISTKKRLVLCHN